MIAGLLDEYIFPEDIINDIKLYLGKLQGMELPEAFLEAIVILNRAYSVVSKS